MTAAAKRPRKLSPAMIAALRGIAQGRPFAHLKTRSHWGAYGHTLRTLQDRGMLDAENNLTSAGRAALDDLATDDNTR